MLNFSNIGKALRQLRLQRSLKQAEVAKKAKVTSPMLSAYETGKQNPSFATIDKILHAMDFDAVDLAAALRNADRQGQSNDAPPKAEMPETGGEMDLRLIRLGQKKLQSSQLRPEEEDFVRLSLPTLIWIVRYLKS